MNAMRMGMEPCWPLYISKNPRQPDTQRLTKEVEDERNM